MSSDSDDRVKRAVEKFAKAVGQDIKQSTLNEIANSSQEQRRIDFLVEFAAKAHAVILPPLRRYAREVNRLLERWSDDWKKAGRAIAAEVGESNDEHWIELWISRGSETKTLTFSANQQKMKVEISSSDGLTNAQLTLDQVTDDAIAPLIAGFVERVLEALARSTR